MFWCSHRPDTRPLLCSATGNDFCEICHSLRAAHCAVWETRFGPESQKRCVNACPVFPIQLHKINRVFNPRGPSLGPRVSTNLGPYTRHGRIKSTPRGPHSLREKPRPTSQCSCRPVQANPAAPVISDRLRGPRLREQLLPSRRRNLPRRCTGSSGDPSLPSQLAPPVSGGKHPDHRAPASPGSTFNYSVRCPPRSGRCRLPLVFTLL